MKTSSVASLPVRLAFPKAKSRSCAEVRAELAFLVKASRPGFWLTAVWFYLLPLGASAPFHSVSFWLGFFYVGFPMGMLIYAGNDIVDVKSDAVNPRKDSWLFGARPSLAQAEKLPVQIALVQIPFIILFTVVIGFKGLLWFGITIMISTRYNRRNGLKDHPVIDPLAQAAYLLVFVLSSWLSGLPQAPWSIWVFGALFAMHSHLFGQIMDIEPDTLAKRRTTAVCIGGRRTKLLIALALCIESALALFITEKPWLAPLLASGAIWFTVDDLFFWRGRPYTTLQAKLFFAGWNIFLLGETFLSWAYWSGFFRIPVLPHL